MAYELKVGEAGLRLGMTQVVHQRGAGNNLGTVAHRGANGQSPEGGGGPRTIAGSIDVVRGHNREMAPAVLADPMKTRGAPNHGRSELSRIALLVRSTRDDGPELATGAV